MKRLIDLIVAVTGLVVILPIMMCLALVLMVDDGWPVLFWQRRAGRHGRGFKMVKLRTMRNARVGDVSDRSRLTVIGRWLRVSSLDELPELYNVVRGDMSLVGPRPLLPEYLPLYSPRQARRHEVRPGITGWAQVNGRNALDWETRLELDVWYVENRSTALDLKILAMTVLTVLRREGISRSGHATMEPFRGEH